MLRELLRFTEKLGRRSLIKPRFVKSSLADRFKQAQGPQSANLRGVFGNIKAHADVRLRAEIVNFARLHIAQYLVEGASIVQIAIDQMHSKPRFVRVLVDMVNPYICGGGESCFPSCVMILMVLFSWSYRLFSKQHCCPSKQDHLNFSGCIGKIDLRHQIAPLAIPGTTVDNESSTEA
jgi:hypothetical protein